MGVEKVRSRWPLLVVLALVLLCLLWWGMTGPGSHRPLVAGGDLRNVGSGRADPETSGAAEAAERVVAPEVPAVVPAIRGVVSSRAGDPVAGAEVRLVREAEDAVPIARATTGPDGGFEFGGAVRAQKPQLIVGAAVGYWSGSTGVPADATPVRFRMIAKLTITGTVRDRETGEPIPGATVDAGGEGGVTDAAGRFRCTAFKVGSSRRVTVRHDTYMSKSVPCAIGDSNESVCDIELDRGSDVTVILVDELTGEPVADAVVKHERKELRTGVDGSVTIRVEDDERSTLQIQADDYISVRWTWRARLPRQDPLTLPMAKTRRIVAEAFDRKQRRLSEASFEIDAPFGGWPIPEPVRVARGVPGYAVYLPGDSPSPGVGPLIVPSVVGRFAIEARYPGFVTATRWLDTADPADPIRARLVLDRAAEIRGVVRCAGEPWDGAIGWHLDGTERSHWVAVRDGRYELDDVPPGAITLRLRNTRQPVPAGVEAKLEVCAGESYERDFRWDSTVDPIFGTVTNMDGTPASGVSVVGLAGDPSHHHVMTRTDEAGSYRLAAVHSHRYRVRVGFGATSRHRDGVTGGTMGVDFVLPLVCRLPLVLFDRETGAEIPVDKADVRVSCRAGSARGEPNEYRLVHNGGNLGPLAAVLPVGTMDLVVAIDRSDYQPAGVSGLRVTEGATAPLRIGLRRGHRVRLRFRGSPESGLQPNRDHLVFLLRPDQLGSVRGLRSGQDVFCGSKINGVRVAVPDAGVLCQRLEFDDAQHATVRGLAPGRYRLLSVPDRLVFDPAKVMVGGDAVPEIAWRPR